MRQALGLQSYRREQLSRHICDDAPIVIHMNQVTLALLVQDTHYRSLFEATASAGSRSKKLRGDWERSCYDGCDPKLRPKDGCLNIAGDICGVKPAQAFGKIFLTLAQHVRYRATFFSADTGNSIKTLEALATNEYYAHILMSYPDRDLESALSVSRIGGAPSQCFDYKEVQIHGQVHLATDVQALSVARKACRCQS